MSYLHDDDQTEIDNLREKIDSMQEQILEGVAGVSLEHVNSGAGPIAGASPAARHSPNNNLTSDLGDITTPLEIDFRLVNNRSLIGNVDGDTVITFVNIPILLEMTMRLYIRSTDPIITIGGTIVSGVGSSPLIVTAVDDFLDISISSTDQSTIVIGTVKKNDKTDEKPSVPQNLSAFLVSDLEIELFWSDPATGTLPITYEVAWSTSNAGNATDGPDTPAAGSPDTGITDNNHIVSGLTIDTTYFFWVRAVNSDGNSDYAGPHEQATLGPPVFTLASPARTMDATVTWVPHMSLLIMEVADDAGFTNIIATRTHARSVSGDWNNSENELLKSIALSPTTLYYVRMRFIKNQVTGPNSAIQNSTTGTLLVPSQPTLTITSPSTGVARVKVRFNDASTRDEIATVTWRLQSSVNEYFSFGGNVYDRNLQQSGLLPPDDLNALENRIEVLRTGPWPNGVLLTFRCVCTNLAGESTADTDDEIIDS